MRRLLAPDPTFEARWLVILRRRVVGMLWCDSHFRVLLTYMHILPEVVIWVGLSGGYRTQSTTGCAVLAAMLLTRRRN
jgi:hypothetical protein